MWIIIQDCLIMPIPKIIHKTHFYKSMDDFPSELKELFVENEKNNPDYEIKYYNDLQCEDFILAQKL